MNTREAGRLRRHRRIRKRVVGMPHKPRLSVFRSHKHLYVQLINDLGNQTVLGCSTASSQLHAQRKQGGNVAAAEQLGKFLATEAVKRGIREVVFDRGGYQYHGRVKAVAEAARAAGLQF